jgi:hypothetical protein
MAAASVNGQTASWFKRPVDRRPADAHSPHAASTASAAAGSALGRSLHAGRLGDLGDVGRALGEHVADRLELLPRECRLAAKVR